MTSKLIVMFRGMSLNLYSADLLYRLVLTLLLVMTPLGCTELSEDATSGLEKLNHGARTTLHPEVGYLALRQGGCTGTLISPSVLITAAHCVRFMSGYGELGFFKLGGAERALDRAISLSMHTGVKDIALLHISEPIPPEIARPAQLAAQEPARGERVTIYGFGCQDRSSLEGGLSLIHI